MGMMSPADRVWLESIAQAARNGEWASTARLMRTFYAGDDEEAEARAARQPRDVLLGHILLLCAVLERVAGGD
jgi:hypothetical protein